MPSLDSSLSSASPSSYNSIIDKLPPEVWTRHILSRLDYGNLKKCQRVCKDLAELTLSPHLDAALFRTDGVRPDRLRDVWGQARRWDEAAIDDMNARKSYSTTWLPMMGDDEAKSATRPTVKLHPLVSAIIMRPGQSWTEAEVPLPHDPDIDTQGSLYFSKPRGRAKVHEALATTLLENACEPPVSRIEIVDRWSGEGLMPRYSLKKKGGGDEASFEVQWASDDDDEEERQHQQDSTWTRDAQAPTTASMSDAALPATEPEPHPRIPHRADSPNYFPRTESEVDPEDIRRMSEQTELQLLALGDVDFESLDADELLELAYLHAEEDAFMAESAGWHALDDDNDDDGGDDDDDPTYHPSGTTSGDDGQRVGTGVQTRVQGVIIEGSDGRAVKIGELLQAWLEAQSEQRLRGMLAPAVLTTNGSGAQFEGFAWARVCRNGTLLLGPVVVA